MKIVFMGTPEFAVPSLRILRSHSCEISAVVTAPDKPRGRGQKISFTPVKEYALQHQIRILQPEHLKDSSFLSALEEIRPDLIVVVAFRILPSEVYSLPVLGSFNLHASLLPKYRGAAPIQWALINGEQETGVTTFFLQEKVDTGSILLQQRVPIQPDDTAGTLAEKLSAAGAALVLQTVQSIEAGSAHPYRQDDSLACPAPKIFKENSRIDWNESSKRIYDFIRGLSPSPAAWTTHTGKTIKIFRTKLTDRTTGRAGTILGRTQNTLEVGTGDGSIFICEIQLEGKRRMGIEEFLRGYSIQPGERFE